MEAAAASHYVDGGTRLAWSWCIACAVARKKFAVVLNEDKTIHSDASPQWSFAEFKNRVDVSWHGELMNEAAAFTINVADSAANFAVR